MPQFGGDPFSYLRRQAMGFVGGVGGSDFTPAALGAKLLLWWDAEDSSTMSLSGSSVTAWTDKSAAFAASQATEANQPTLSATAVNNRPGVVFDGVDDVLTNAGTPSKVPAGNPREWWFLGTQTRDSANTTSGRVWRQGAAIGTAVQLVRVTGNGINSNVGDGTNPVLASIASGFAGVSIVRQQVTASQNIVTLNGATTGSAAVVPSLTNSSMFIGARDAVSMYHQGAINTLIQTEPLTDGEASQMLAWLKARGGIA